MKFSVYTIFVFCSYYCTCTMNAHSYLLGCCSRACLWSWCRRWSWWPEGWWREQWSSRDHRSIQSCDSKMEYSLLSPTQYHHCNGYKMELLQCQAFVDLEEDNKVHSLFTKDNRRWSPTKTGSHIRAISFVISERTLFLCMVHMTLDQGPCIRTLRFR